VPSFRSAFVSAFEATHLFTDRTTVVAAHHRTYHSTVETAVESSDISAE
jgi:hypothetical protein